MQQHHHLLRAAHGKGRHHDMAAAPDGTVHQACQLLLHRPYRLVQPVAIGALHDEVLGCGRSLGVVDNRQILSPHVAGEQQPRRLALLAGLDQNARRSQHVPGVGGGRGKARIRRRTGEQLRRMQLHRLELLHRLRRILLGVKRRHFTVARRNAKRPPPPRPFVHELRVRLLNMPAVLQHLLAQIDRRRGRIDRSAISLLRPAAAGRRYGRCAHERAQRRSTVRPAMPGAHSSRGPAAGAPETARSPAEYSVPRIRDGAKSPSPSVQRPKNAIESPFTLLLKFKPS